MIESTALRSRFLEEMPRTSSKVPSRVFAGISHCESEETGQKKHSECSSTIWQAWVSNNICAVWARFLDVDFFVYLEALSLYIGGDINDYMSLLIPGE